ncbi:hypothetical protein BH10PLA1_BH10PLA1_13540 [soil metagenome]
MNDVSPATYADWKAPAGDGEMLIWPEPADLLRQSRENHGALSAASDVMIQNAPLSDLRRAQRCWIGHTDDDALLFATGHQTELIHPGVWVKDALIHSAAEATGGQAYHFAVDTDSPKHLQLKWPGGSQPLTDDPNAITAEWSGLLGPPTPEHLAQLTKSFDSAAGAWPFKPLAPEFLASMRRLSLESQSLDAAMVNAMHAIDWSLGLRHHAMVVSPIFQSLPYLSLVYHVLSRSRDFASDYNTALYEYRKEAGITNPGRPMPDLQMSATTCEVPFWLDNLSTGGRERAQVACEIDGCVMRSATGERFVFKAHLPADEAAHELLRWLRLHNLRLAPRALMLTTFIRLFIADQFVHGIGGGRYDQVTDKLIARHFKLAAPKFSVTTATLFFPTAVNESRVCLPCIAMEGHQLRHRVLGEKKMAMVAAIEGLPRKSMERAQQFQAMQRELALMARSEPIVAWENKFKQAKERREMQERLFDRELFYAVQPAGRLHELLERCVTAMSDLR